MSSAVCFIQDRLLSFLFLPTYPVKIHEMFTTSSQALGKTASPFLFHSSNLLTQLSNSTYLLCQHYFPILKYKQQCFQYLDLLEVIVPTPYLNFFCRPLSLAFLCPFLTLRPFFLCHFYLVGCTGDFKILLKRKAQVLIQVF